MNFSKTAFVAANAFQLYPTGTSHDVRSSSLRPLTSPLLGKRSNTTAPPVSSAAPNLRAQLQPRPTDEKRCECHPDILSVMTARARDDVALLGRMGAAAVLTAAVLLGTIAQSEVLAEVPTTPPPIGVYDDAGVMPKSNVSLFERAAGNIDKQTGYHVHFVMLKSLPYGETPNEYARQLAEDWKLGDKDVLFVASTKLARAGVFAGASAKESVLPDDVAKSIAEETFGIPAGEERYGSALLDVSNRLIPVLSGEADPGPPIVKNTEVVQTFKTKEETKNDRTKYIKVVGGILVIAFIAPLIQTYWYVRDD